MSRRRLATVVRVAELRERVAKGQVALRAAGVQQARGEQQRREERLSATAFDGSRVPQTVAELTMRAEAVTASVAELATATAEHRQAQALHTEAARRTRLLTSLADRLRAEDDARRAAADQRTADDSTTARQIREDRR